jgi:asparagine synthase (glutamine-hydrolysing)
MSGFFGIFNPKGTGVDKDAFGQMRRAADRPGHDGIETYHDEYIAFGHVMLRVSPDSKHDLQPLKSSCGNYIIVGHFRLDYRDELGDKLGLSHKELLQTSDSKLAILSYQKWGSDSYHHLEGDWSFVIFDIKERSISMMKDKTGISACFYFTDHEKLIFASDTAFILSIDSIDFEVDDAELLNIASMPGYPTHGKTLVKNIYTLRNRELVCFDFHCTVKQTIFSEQTSYQLRYVYEDDYCNDFLFLYQSAVRNRLGGQQKNGFFLSGGLDSSSLTGLAALLSEKSNDEIIAFTSIPDKNFQLPESQYLIYDETDLVLSLKEYYKNIQTNFVSFSDTNILSDLELYIKKNAFHPILTKNSNWIAGIFDLAQNRGIRNVLTGQNGNYTITWTGSNYYFDLLLRFKLKRFVKEIINEIMLQKNVLHTLKVVLIAPLIIYLKTITSSFLHYSSPMENPYLNGVNKDSFFVFSNLIRSKVEFIKNNLIPFQRVKLSLQNNAFYFTGIKWYLNGSKKNIIISDPTCDERLVFFLNVIPQRLFFKNAKRKYLFKEVMGRFLPEKILNNSLRKIQSGDFEHKIHKYMPNNILSDSNHTKIGPNLFLKAGLLKSVKIKIENSPGKFMNSFEIIHLLKSISLGYFWKTLKMF